MAPELWRHQHASRVCLEQSLVEPQLVPMVSSGDAQAKNHQLVTGECAIISPKLGRHVLRESEIEHAPGLSRALHVGFDCLNRPVSNEKMRSRRRKDPIQALD